MGKRYFILFISIILNLTFFVFNINAIQRDNEKLSVAVEIYELIETKLSERINIIGSLVPKFEIGVKSEFQGVINRIYVKEWLRVKKGQPLVSLDHYEADTLVSKAIAVVESSRAVMVQSKAALDFACREYGRLLKLRDLGLITEQKIDNAFTEKEVFLARFIAARAHLKIALDDLFYAETRLNKALILSPMDGVISYRGVNIGEIVGEPSSTRLMFKIVDNRILELTTMIPSHNIRYINIGQPLIFTTEAYPDQTFIGKVMFINPSVTSNDRSFKVVSEIFNKEDLLKGGLFIKGHIIISQRYGVLQVPRLALQAWDIKNNDANVFIVKNGIAVRRKVMTGTVNNELVEIISGLKVGDLVVTRGNFNLKDGDIIKIVSRV